MTPSTTPENRPAGDHRELENEPLRTWARPIRFRVPDLFRLRVIGAIDEMMAPLLTSEALLFIEELEEKFGERRRELLFLRTQQAARFARGERPGFLPQTLSIRESNWVVAPPPSDLINRRVEITGPAEPKVMVEALNSGAAVFMADLEDALSPTWENAMHAQAALRAAAHGRLEARDADGTVWNVNESPTAPRATLMMRPRGWHLSEKHIRFDGTPVSASLVDFGLYFFHNVRELAERGSGAYLYLPKLESHLEARLWNDVFVFSEERLRVPRGTIRATVMIETVQAAFEMNEMLYELREHATGLCAGRWDYLFSVIKSFSETNETMYPERSKLTMELPFMRAYTKLLVATSHRRQAHAIGGIAAESTSESVRGDKIREAADGFDGTWVSDPKWVPLANEVFARQLGARANQKDAYHEEGFSISADDLLPKPISGAKLTEQCVSQTISMAIQYLSAWLQGHGAVTVGDRVEDLASAEVARTELWQWVKREVEIEGGSRLTRQEFLRRLESERACFAGQAERGRITEACDLLEKLVLSEEIPEFLTVSGYQVLEHS